jgi:hypothetical protein
MLDRALVLIYGLAAWAVASGIMLGLSLVALRPGDLGPAGVTVWFVLLLSWLAALLSVALFTLKSYLHIGSGRSARWRYSWRQGLLIAGWASGLLALSSLRQLSLRDVILTGVILVFVEIYVRFRWP